MAGRVQAGHGQPAGASEVTAAPRAVSNVARSSARGDLTSTLARAT